MNERIMSFKLLLVVILKECTMGTGVVANTLSVFYATQTGNALDVAERIAREAERRACQVVLRSMDEFDPNALTNEECAVFVVSTTGQGDPPDSMKSFWRFLLKKNLAAGWLEGVHYAVFGLGDSGYQKYNFVAKKLDRRLSDLGATVIIERGLGDDQHPSGYEGSLDPWLSSLWPKLFSVRPSLFPSGPDFVLADSQLFDQPKIYVTHHQNVEELAEIGGLEHLRMQITRARGMSSLKFLKNKNSSECFLKLIKNHSLTREGCGKDVRHMEFEFVSKAVEYEVGDVLDVLPSQNPDSVDSFIRHCNLDPEALVTVHHEEKCVDVAPIKLRTFVELTMDVASASPRRFFFEVMSYFATAEHERERLQYFISPEGRDDLYKYNQKERRTVIEVLEDFPSVRMPFEWLVQLVPPLKTRSFSISSSSLAHPNQVHLTVSVVSWTTPYKRKRSGLCSTWFAGLSPNQDIYVPAWLHKGSLPAPPTSLPIILVGPGTGCAPFRGFLEDRALADNHGSAAPIMFFFGCRNEDSDYLYKDLWLSHSHANGLLSESRGGGLYVAFSRDQPQKIYVQHKIKEHSKRVWNLLSDGAAIYVAGASTKMPADVMAAFEEVISQESGIPKEAAVGLLRKLEREGKYNVEAWS